MAANLYYSWKCSHRQVSQEGRRFLAFANGAAYHFAVIACHPEVSKKLTDSLSFAITRFTSQESAVFYRKLTKHHRTAQSLL